MDGNLQKVLKGAPMFSSRMNKPFQPIRLLGTHLFSKIAKSSHFDGKKRGTFFGILQAYAKHLKCSLSQYEVLPPTYLLSSSSSCRSFLEAATKVNAAGDGWIVKSLSGTGESRGLSIVSSVKKFRLSSCIVVATTVAAYRYLRKSTMRTK